MSKASGGGIAEEDETMDCTANNTNGGEENEDITKNCLCYGDKIVLRSGVIRVEYFVYKRRRHHQQLIQATTTTILLLMREIKNNKCIHSW